MEDNSNDPIDEIVDEDGDLWPLLCESVDPDRSIRAAVALMTANKGSVDTHRDMLDTMSSVGAVSREFSAAEALDGLLRIAHAALVLLGEERGEDPDDILRAAVLSATT